jgi:hypothetical protein
MRRKGVLCLILIVGLVTTVSVAAGEEQVVGEPDIDVSVADNRLSPSERATLEVVVSNSGDLTRGGPAEYERRVKTARNVRISINERRLDDSIEAKTGTVVLGAVQDGAPRKASFVVETDGEIQTGRYNIPVTVEYDSTRVVEYTETAKPPGYTDPKYRDFDREVDKTFEVVVEEDPTFEAYTQGSTDLYAGDTGRFEMSVRNVGEETAHEARVRLESESKNIGFGPLANPRSSTTVSASEIPAGESELVSVKMNADPDAVPGEYPVAARVEYLNENGVEDVSDKIPVSVSVGDERRFRIDNLETEGLHVGENDVVVTGEAVNTGPATAHNAVVSVSSDGAISPTGPESAVGDLPPNGSERVRFKLAVGEDAEPGEKLLTFGVRYENDDGEVRQASTPVRKRVTVGEEVDTFEIVDVETSVEPGGSNSVELEVRNNGDYKTENANAKIFLNDPLSSSDNSAFLGNLEPGETTTAVFRVSATGDAVPKEYDASMEVRYEDRTGDTELADGMSFGLPVSESSGGIPVVYVLGGLAVVLISAGVFVYQRR